jgi:citrate lyase subunit beta/citryl-CoA lyase
VPIANAVFRPTDAEIAHSLQVVAAARRAADEGVGAFTVNGRMVDAPFIRRAEQVLEVARRLGLVSGDERSIE